jgi:hypothetical protein
LLFLWICSIEGVDKTFVSTKTSAVMGLLARQVATVRLEEGLTRQGAAHDTPIGVFLDHAFPQNATEEA